MSINSTQHSAAAKANLDRLAQLGLPAPAGMVAAFELADAARGYAVDNGVDEFVAALRTATPDTVAEILDNFAAKAAREEIYRTTIRSAVFDATDRAVIAAHVAAVDEILETVRPAFTRLADEFTTAVAALPERWHDPQALIDAGPAAVAAWGTAQNLAATLQVCADLRHDLPGLAIHGLAAAGVEFTRTTSLDAAEDAIRNAKEASGAGRGHLGWWVALLRTPGIDGLVWRNAAEHRAALGQLSRVETQLGPSGRSRVRVFADGRREQAA